MIISTEGKKSFIWQNKTYFHDKKNDKLGREGNFCNRIKAMYLRSGTGHRCRSPLSLDRALQVLAEATAQERDQRHPKSKRKKWGCLCRRHDLTQRKHISKVSEYENMQKSVAFLYANEQSHQKLGKQSIYSNIKKHKIHRNKFNQRWKTCTLLTETEDTQRQKDIPHAGTEGQCC